MPEKWNKKQIAIFNILKHSTNLISSPKITELMNTNECEISERTVRYYLEYMRKLNYAEKIGKQGFRITERGLNEINSRTVLEKIGFLSTKIDKMSYRMTFNPDKLSGTVLVNISIVNPAKIKALIPQFKRVFEKGYSMGELMTIFIPGEQIEDLVIPKDKIGIGTVCSLTLNGVFLKYGIPINPLFGGILVFENDKPVGFAELIMYKSTSIDPMEIFIGFGITDHFSVIKDGTGKVGASFREFPSECIDHVNSSLKKMKKAHLGSFFTMGSPGKSLLKIPVSEGCIGAIVMGGLNPIAIFRESGIKFMSKALSGLVDYNKLFHYKEFENRLKRIL